MGYGQAFKAVYGDGGIYGISPRPDRMYPIESYVLRGAGCHDNGDHDRDFYSPALVGGSAGPAVLPLKVYSHAGRRASAACNYVPTIPLCIPADSHSRAVDFEPPAHHGQSRISCVLP
eukprot:1266450-Pleurochrysis_carterae.AAC.1